MAPEPKDREMEAVLKLTPWERYLHFLKHVVTFDQVWMAEDDEGLVTICDREGVEVLPVWPARRYAEHALKKTWPGARNVAVPVQDWLERTLRPLRNDDDAALAVFPDSEGYGQQVSIPDVIDDVEAELATRLGSLPGFDSATEEIDLDELLKPAMRASMKAKPKGKLP